VCADLNAELREFNGETDHVHLLAHYPPGLALSVLVNQLKGVSARRLRQQYPTEVRKRGASTSGPRPTSPPPAEAHR
jgi:putative transposase